MINFAKENHKLRQENHELLQENNASIGEVTNLKRKVTVLEKDGKKIEAENGVLKKENEELKNLLKVKKESINPVLDATFSPERADRALGVHRKSRSGIHEMRKPKPKRKSWNQKEIMENFSSSGTYVIDLFKGTSDPEILSPIIF